ncbi:hypothetical protein IGS67_07315 [Flavimobilis sp. GY10621]|uniref:IPT/TIG domain-containing protein n=1 Tax=Flavimobilis rhizosphaerae TaxID=2775421 RepID=A0ABR9DQW0_9MICO|nr:hypothetical protein [Flavimobilis rhizosphaerae]MBD9699299.1 hypothetical protein [Flavimobilis rhizosphaerae]
MRTRRIVAATAAALALAGCAATEAYIDYVSPSISSAPTAAPGATITVTGAEFIADRRDRVRYDVFGREHPEDRSHPAEGIEVVLVVGEVRTTLVTVDAAADGTWTATVVVPATAPPGMATLEADADGLAVPATTSLTLVAASGEAS